MKVTLQLRDTLAPKLAEIRRKIAHPQPILLAMATDMAHVIAGGSFRDPSLRAAPWAPLRPSTIAAKRGAGGILRGPNANLARSFVPSATDKAGRVTTDRPYAAFHQFGTRPYTIRPKSKKALNFPGAPHPVKLAKHPGLPARPMLPFIGGPQSATIAPFAKERLRKAGQRALELLLK